MEYNFQILLSIAQCYETLNNIVILYSIEYILPKYSVPTFCFAILLLKMLNCLVDEMGFHVNDLDAMFYGPLNLVHNFLGVG